jgi:phage tail protein X
MTEPGVKIAAACSVLLGGILVALMFRHDLSGAGTEVPGNRDALVLGNRLRPSQVGGPVPGREHSRHESPFSAPAAAGAGGRSVTVVTPTYPGEAPPELARDYPGSSLPPAGHFHVPPNEPGTSGWGTSITLPLASRRPPLMRTHKIADGDTLEILAERYLGSADRYAEIYEANRDVLPSSVLLPIGVQLKIPPLDCQAPQSSGLFPQRVLVPIAPRTAGED